MPPKKKPKVDPLPTDAPEGYHYYGEPARIFNDKVTLPLRKDINAIREVKYQDLYCESVGSNGSVVYLCAVMGCTKCSVPMFKAATGIVQFNNFFSHLSKHHQEYLFEVDRDCTAQGDALSTIQNFFLPHISETSTVTDISVTPISQAEKRSENKSTAKLKEKLISKVVKVVSNGPYPIPFLANPAVRHFLIEVDVVPPNFDFPSTRTVGRRYFNNYIKYN